MGNNFLRKMKFISIAALAILSVSAEDTPPKTCGEASTFKVETFTDKECKTPEDPVPDDFSSYTGAIVDIPCTTKGTDMKAECTTDGWTATKYDETDGTCATVTAATDDAPNPVVVKWGEC